MTAFCSWLVAHGSSCLEFAGVVLGIIYVYLSARENLWSWPTSLLNAALFVPVFLEKGLYSDMGLQVVYFVLSLYGWYEWLYGGKGHSELRVSRTSIKLWGILTLIAFGGWIALGAITSRIPGSALPYGDAALVSTSLIAQYMTTKKLLENWIVWIVVDVFYVGVFIYKGLNLVAFNYAVYLGLAVLGYIEWKKSFAVAPEPA
ncbi:MAG TPA: nicotinamide riboside transporter PnuC [Gemmatimonadaceae bacterium]|jgi:nicotinamide mononucleotide transporter